MNRFPYNYSPIYTIVIPCSPVELSVMPIDDLLAVDVLRTDFGHFFHSVQINKLV